MYFVPYTSIRHSDGRRNLHHHVLISQHYDMTHLVYSDGSLGVPLSSDDFKTLIQHVNGGVITAPVYDYFDGQWRYGVGTPEQHCPDGEAGDVYIDDEGRPMTYMGDMFWEHVITGEKGHGDVYIFDPTEIECVPTYITPSVGLLGGPFKLSRRYRTLKAKNPVGKRVGATLPYYFHNWYVFSRHEFSYTLEIGDENTTRYTMPQPVVEIDGYYRFDNAVYSLVDGKMMRVDIALSPIGDRRYVTVRLNGTTFTVR